LFPDETARDSVAGVGAGPRKRTDTIDAPQSTAIASRYLRQPL